jgi:hypothetical protein
MRQSQKDKILTYLLSGKTLTPLDALKMFGCFRLGARIFDLRAAGYKIENVGADEANYAAYRLVPPRPITLPPAFPGPVAPPEKQQALF